MTTLRNRLAHLLAIAVSGIFLSAGLSAAQSAPAPAFSSLQSAAIERVLIAVADVRSPGERSAAISAHFIDVPYRNNTLIGSPSKPEALVVRLDGFDCFTFLDVVEALRRSRSASEFPERLTQVRYRHGSVAYEHRRHFFSDWVADNDTPLVDVTLELGQGRQRTVQKDLNLKSNGSLWLPGIGITPRRISFIPASAVDMDFAKLLRPGDYVGLYSDLPGLDVTHTGLIVENDGAIMLRHASSRSGVERVVDEPLITYMRGMTGLIVYRVLQ